MAISADEQGGLRYLAFIETDKDLKGETDRPVSVKLNLQTMLIAHKYCHHLPADSDPKVSIRAKICELHNEVLKLQTKIQAETGKLNEEIHKHFGVRERGEA